DTWPEMEASGGAIVLEASVAAFCAAIRQQIATPVESKRMGAKGRDWALQNLDAQAATHQLLGQYEAHRGGPS
ncbi:MAG: hypothetical protein VXW42_05980, partial [Planctomycetota bacterium]|nr:hypothetical protein [Planctomycetota bacterium]